MVDKNLKLLENGATHLRDNGDVRFYLSAVRMHHLSECVGRHQTVLLVNVVQEKKTRNTVKGDDVKAFTKASNCENVVLYFSEKVQKMSAFAMLFWFSVQSLENGFGFPY